MKSAESKTTTTFHLPQAQRASQPFFSQKDGDGAIFSEAKPEVQPFFQPQIYPFLQTKLTIGQPGDKYEQEADAMADEVEQRLVVGPNSGREQLESGQGSKVQPKSISEPNEPAPESQVQRKPMPMVQLTPERLTREQFERRITAMERNGQITSENAVELLEANASLGRRARARIVARALELDRAGRSSRGHRLVSNLQIEPRTIRVSEGEGARISFDVIGDSIRSISCFIFEHEREIPTSRFFHFNNPTPGHKVAIWDGTWDFSRNRPPRTGTFRVNIWVSDQNGRQEQMWGHIRVENPDEETVLPRTNSGLALTRLDFNGNVAVLSDERGNQIEARAVSGLRRNNPRNRTGRDYSLPEYQSNVNRGPIPEGSYEIRGNSVQQPDIRRGRLVYPTGQSAGGWGPFRIPLHPSAGTNTFGRSEFFFHLDVSNDGTAGCIGIQSQDVGKFNQMVALMMRIPAGTSLPVIVRYQ